jgi:hypothetical protein
MYLTFGSDFKCGGCLDIVLSRLPQGHEDKKFNDFNRNADSWSATASQPKGT